MKEGVIFIVFLIGTWAQYLFVRNHQFFFKNSSGVDEAVSFRFENCKWYKNAFLLCKFRDVEYNIFLDTVAPIIKGIENYYANKVHEIEITDKWCNVIVRIKRLNNLPSEYSTERYQYFSNIKGDNITINTCEIPFDRNTKYTLQLRTIGNSQKNIFYFYTPYENYTISNVGLFALHKLIWAKITLTLLGRYTHNRAPTKIYIFSNSSIENKQHHFQNKDHFLNIRGTRDVEVVFAIGSSKDDYSMIKSELKVFLKFVPIHSKRPIGVLAIGSLKKQMLIRFDYYIYANIRFREESGTYIFENALVTSKPHPLDIYIKYTCTDGRNMSMQLRKSFDFISFQIYNFSLTNCVHKQPVIYELQNHTAEIFGILSNVSLKNEDLHPEIANYSWNEKKKTLTFQFSKNFHFLDLRKSLYYSYSGKKRFSPFQTEFKETPTAFELTTNLTFQYPKLFVKFVPNGWNTEIFIDCRQDSSFYKKIFFSISQLFESLYVAIKPDNKYLYIRLDIRHLAENSSVHSVTLKAKKSQLNLNLFQKREIYKFNLTVFFNTGGQIGWWNETSLHQYLLIKPLRPIFFRRKTTALYVQSTDTTISAYFICNPFYHFIKHYSFIVVKGNRVDDRAFDGVIEKYQKVIDHEGMAYMTTSPFMPEECLAKKTVFQYTFGQSRFCNTSYMNDYFCNGALKPGQKYHIMLRGFTFWNGNWNDSVFYDIPILFAATKKESMINYTYFYNTFMNIVKYFVFFVILFNLIVWFPVNFLLNRRTGVPIGQISVLRRQEALSKRMKEAYQRNISFKDV